MNKIYFSLIIVATFFFLFPSCEIYNPEETVPSYIHIDKINLVTNPSTQGTNSCKITDAWVFVDDQSIGAFELPATFPVLFDGNHKITIKAGIKLNGIAMSRAIYPFYTEYSQNYNLVKDSVLIINPTISYNSSSIFQWRESFEDGGTTIEKMSTSDTSIDKTSDVGDVFEGSYSSVINLDATRSTFEGQSSTNFAIPLGKTVFLELNYKTNNTFNIGVIAYYNSSNTKRVIYGVNHSSEWNKIYINLTNQIRDLYIPTNPPSYKIYFKVDKEIDVIQPKIFFDNIKLLY